MAARSIYEIDFVSDLLCSSHQLRCATAPCHSVDGTLRHTLFVIRGELYPPVSLPERMAQLKVSAVSIAVVRDRTLDWARAHGFAGRERNMAATPDTLFQAGSISKPIAACASTAVCSIWTVTSTIVLGAGTCLTTSSPPFIRSRSATS